MSPSVDSLDFMWSRFSRSTHCMSAFCILLYSKLQRYCAATECGHCRCGNDTSTSRGANRCCFAVDVYVYGASSCRWQVHQPSKWTTAAVPSCSEHHEGLRQLFVVYGYASIWLSVALPSSIKTYRSRRTPSICIAAAQTC